MIFAYTVKINVYDQDCKKEGTYFILNILIINNVGTYYLSNRQKNGF